MRDVRVKCQSIADDENFANVLEIRHPLSHTHQTAPTPGIPSDSLSGHTLDFYDVGYGPERVSGSLLSPAHSDMSTLSSATLRSSGFRGVGLNKKSPAEPR
ncbi:hypothetical protein CEXT_476831 [Caerostris extrusa]|uniref:Uncharacterized protein n=1 Tax=Caerostris extrusa TaxID=172846 RepID=A0AAV4QW87_CAEEX|nr:hypothetical protein CEXT_476831 [Caerostris extrusa]